jgi:hypothetical protein
LHVLHHCAVAPCPGHLDGVHFTRVVGAEHDCPFCFLASTVVPAVRPAAFFLILLCMLPTRMLRPPFLEPLAVRSRAPPR